MSNWLQPIEVKVQLTKKDVLYLIYKSIFNDFIIGLGSGALVLGLGYYISSTAEVGDKNIMIIGLSIVVILSLFAAIYMVNKKSFSNERIKELNMRYRFSQSTIEIEDSEGLLVLTWDSIYNLEETSKYFFIYRNKESFYVIPKSYFKDSNDMADIRQLFKSTIEESKLELM